MKTAWAPGLLILVARAQNQPRIACEAHVDEISPRLFLLDGTVPGLTHSKGNRSRNMFVRGRGFGCVASVQARLAHAHEQAERVLHALVLNESTIVIEMCKFGARSGSSEAHATDPAQATDSDGGATHGSGMPLPRTSAVAITLMATNGARNQLWISVLFLDPMWPAAAAAATSPMHQLWQLQLGCGRDFADGWLNLDALFKTTPFYDWGLASDQADSRSHAHLQRSLVRWRWDDLLEAFPLSSVAAITVAFALGYTAPRVEARRAVFRAFERALRPGGVARVADTIDPRPNRLMTAASIAKIAVEEGLCVFEVDPWTSHYSGHANRWDFIDGHAPLNEADRPQPTRSPLQIARSSYMEMWHSAPRRSFYLEVTKPETSGSAIKKCPAEVVPLRPALPSFSSLGLAYAEEMLLRGTLLPSLQPPPPLPRKPRARAQDASDGQPRAQARWWRSWLASGGDEAVAADARRLDAALGLSLLPAPVVHSGLVAAGAMRAVVCGLMRNSGAAAARSLARLSRLCHHVFGQCVAIIVLLGASDDDTERTAHAWAAHEPRAVLLHDAHAGVPGVGKANFRRNFAQHTSGTAAADHGAESAERFRVMAGLRDRLLEEAEVRLQRGVGQPQGVKVNSKNILVMADLDMPIGWPERGILATLGDMRDRGVDWHALTSHSVSWQCGGLFASLCAPLEARLPLAASAESKTSLRSGQPVIDPRWRGGLVRGYDSIAFRSCPPPTSERASVSTRNAEGCPEQGVPVLPSRTDGVREKSGGPSPHDPLAHVLRVGATPIPVRSAFGGLSIYRASSLNGLRYSSHANNTAGNGAECEHVALHRRLRARVSKQDGRAEAVVLLCPSMVVAHTHVLAPPSHARTDSLHAKNTIPPFSHELSGSGNGDIGSGVVVQGEGWFKAKPTSSAAARNWWYKLRHIRDAIPLDRASCSSNLLELRRALEAADASLRSDTDVADHARSDHNSTSLINAMWLSEGTALGVVRALEAAAATQLTGASDHNVGTEGFISHDDDVDVSFPYTMAEHFLRHALPLLLSPGYGFELGQVETERCGRRCLFIALLRRGEKIDIDFMGSGLDCKANSRRGDAAVYSNGTVTASGLHEEVNSTSCAERCDDMLRFFSGDSQSQVRRPGLGSKRPSLHLALRPVKFLGTSFWLPQHAEAYLEYLYGSDWRKPRRTRAKPQYTQRR